MIQNPSLPTQQAAVTQQLQSNPIPSAEFNAIKINITGAQVSAPQQPIEANIPALPTEGQKIDYKA